MTLQDPREGFTLFATGSPKVHRPRSITCTVSVLATRITKEYELKGQNAINALYLCQLATHFKYGVSRSIMRAVAFLGV